MATSALINIIQELLTLDKFSVEYHPYIMPVSQFERERTTRVNFDELAGKVGGEVVRTKSGEKTSEKLLVGDKRGVFNWSLIREIIPQRLSRVFFQDEFGRADVTDLSISVNGSRIVFEVSEA